MVVVNGEKYSTEYIWEALCRLKASGIRDNGKDTATVSLAVQTQKGEVHISVAPDEYHSIFVDLLANRKQYHDLHVQGDFPDDKTTVSLPLATIEVPDEAVDHVEYRENNNKVVGCPRIMLYNGMGDDTSVIVMVDGDGLCIVSN